MKKSGIISICLLSFLCLQSLSCQNWQPKQYDSSTTPIRQAALFDYNLSNDLNTPPAFEFLYKVESRFMSRISKEKLHQAKSVVEIFPKHATEGIESYHFSEVALVTKEGDIKETGDSELLNATQKKLLQSADYSTNFYAKAKYQYKVAGSETLRNDHLIYYMTVVPNKEAAYQPGNDALIAFLKEGTIEEANSLERESVKPGRIHFTVNQKGDIENVILESSSGHASLDNRFVERVKALPGKWDPGRNINGDAVSQRLVFFFGLQGC